MKKFFQWLLPTAWFKITVVEEKIYKVIDYKDIPITKNPVQIFEVEPEATATHEGLGIRDERAKEIYKIVKRAVNSSDNTVETMVLVSKQLTHPNELYYSCIVLDREVSKLENPLHGLFESFLKSREQ